MIVKELKDRVRGIIIGLAAGDRIGGPIRMAVRLAESLAIQNRFDLDHIKERYFKWWAEDGFDAGLVTDKVFELVKTGISFNMAAERVDWELNGYTAGCNPVHRNFPVAMASFIEDNKLPIYAIQEASSTHKHILAGDVAAATLVLCRNLIRGIDWLNALKHAAAGRTIQTRQAFQINSGQLLNNGGYAPYVLNSAVYFLNQSSSFVEALSEAITFAGPTNYCPVVVGAIGGARWGASGIPQSELFHCNILSRVHTVADLLAGQW